MSEVIDDKEPQPAAKTYTEAEVAELVAGLKSNTEKLLAEKKEAARKAKEAEDARLLAEQEQARNLASWSSSSNHCASSMNL